MPAQAKPESAGVKQAKKSPIVADRALEVLGEDA